MSKNEKSDWPSTIIGCILMAALLLPNFFLIESRANQEILIQKIEQLDKKIEHLKKAQRPSERTYTPDIIETTRED